MGDIREMETALPEVEHGTIKPLTGPGLGTRLQPDILKRAGATVRRSGPG